MEKWFLLGGEMVSSRWRNGFSDPSGSFLLCEEYQMGMSEFDKVIEEIEREEAIPKEILE